MVFDDEILQILEKKTFDKEIHQLLTDAVSSTICFLRNAWKSSDDVLGCAITSVGGYGSICEGTRDELKFELMMVLEWELVEKAVSTLKQCKSVEYKSTNEMSFEFALETPGGRVVLAIRNEYDPEVWGFYDIERGEWVHDTDSTIDAWVDEITKE